MKLLFGEKGNFDFDTPLEMNKVQKEQFIRFLEEIFEVVEIEPVDSFRSERLGEKIFGRMWTRKEFNLLADTNKTTEELAEALGRSWMSVDIKRGFFLPDLLLWVDDKGETLASENIERLVKEYLEEKAKEMQFNKERKKEINESKKEIERLTEELDSWDEPKRKSEVELLSKFNKINDLSVDEYINVRKNNLKKQIKELQEFIEEE